MFYCVLLCFIVFYVSIFLHIYVHIYRYPYYPSGSGALFILLRAGETRGARGDPGVLSVMVRLALGPARGGHAQPGVDLGTWLYDFI